MFVRGDQGPADTHPARDAAIREFERCAIAREHRRRVGHAKPLGGRAQLFRRGPQAASKALWGLRVRAKYMGDATPQAHEDDAERAVRAGLKLIAAVSDLKTHAPLQTRVGIATGLVVVGDLIGSGASQEQAIVGETPNLAARLQGVAEPNSVVIAEGTRKLLGNLFELEELGPKELKPGPNCASVPTERGAISIRSNV
jgi:class 3 adenylate cyclase